MALAAVGPGEVLALTTVGLLLYGVGIGVWDVAMNVEGAEVERGLGRTIMPRFHAGFSGGTVVGALLGALLVELSVPAVVHPVAVVAPALAPGVGDLAALPADRRGPRRRAHVCCPGSARAAHAADRGDGAGPGDDRGHCQRLARGRPGRSTATTSRTP
ncbi:hypothetical protein [Nocardioides sp. B-3]|uniref:hypothetical protein n=1 Tax=Nocardioides sp. B-3 TaxID=2895565 RepID=UPI002152A55A|nr:hypothetical protein [Nocardioides sp. B-3]UUZ58356.1 hypothetical protein LP418_19440 [Nocardioides sp. B-3]